MTDRSEIRQRWNVEETRKHVTRLFGRAQLEMASPSLRSVDDRMMYAQIHYQAMRACIDAYVSSELEDKSLLVAILGGEDAGAVKFNIFVREVAAHLTACVQSVHAIPDILAYGIYYALGFNLQRDALKPRAVSPSVVVARLARDIDTAKLSALLQELVTGGEFNHLSALANRAKHRSIVFPLFGEDQTAEREARHAVTIPAFEHDGASYKQVFADSFLADEYLRCSKLEIEIGCELNRVLANRLAAPFLPMR